MRFGRAEERRRQACTLQYGAVWLRIKKARGQHVNTCKRSPLRSKHGALFTLFTLQQCCLTRFTSTDHCGCSFSLTWQGEAAGVMLSAACRKLKSETRAWPRPTLPTASAEHHCPRCLNRLEWRPVARCSHAPTAWHARALQPQPSIGTSASAYVPCPM